MCEISTHVTNIYDNNYYFIVAFISYNHVINSARICDYQNQNTLLRGQVAGSCIYHVTEFFVSSQIVVGQSNFLADAC